MRVTLSPHAITGIKERAIAVEWVEGTIKGPERTESDRDFADRRHALRRIEAYGGRWLRVVYTDDGEERRVITAFFDRKAGRRL